MLMLASISPSYIMKECQLVLSVGLRVHRRKGQNVNIGHKMITSFG